jgi:hypothetical protein
MIMTIAAGGVLSESLASRFTKDARRVAGRCLEKNIRGAEKEFCHTEKPGTVLKVQDIAVEEGVEAGVEGGVVPAR